MHIENLPRAEEAQAFQNTCTDVWHCFSVAIPMHFLHSVPLFYASHLLPCLSHLAVLLCPKAQEFWGCTRMILLSISGSFMALGCCVKEHSASDPTKCCGFFFPKVNRSLSSWSRNCIALLLNPSLSKHCPCYYILVRAGILISWLQSGKRWIWSELQYECKQHFFPSRCLFSGLCKW